MNERKPLPPSAVAVESSDANKHINPNASVMFVSMCGQAVEKWVVVCLQIMQHYSKPRVTPVEILPVFPDFKVSYNGIRFSFGPRKLSAITCHNYGML